MKITVFVAISFFAAIFASEECKFRKNYLAYVTSGVDKVQGLTPPQVQIAIIESFRIWERTIYGIEFIATTPGIYLEPFEISIEFISFQQLFAGSTWSEHKGRTFTNCTTLDDQIYTIHNATINIKTDHVYKTNNDNVRTKSVGAHIVPVLVKEIGHALGLNDSAIETSAMYWYPERFNVVLNNGGRIPTTDLIAVNSLYPLCSGEMPAKKALV